MAYLEQAQLAAIGVHYIYYPLDYMLDAQQKAGYKTLELRGMAPHYLIGRYEFQNPHELRKKTEARGMCIGCFAPECNAYHYTLCGVDEAFRLRSVEYFKRSIESAVGMGASIVLLNCMGGTFDEENERAYARAVNSLSALAPVAQDCGVTLVVETLCSTQSRIVNTLPALCGLLKDVGHPQVKASLDTVSMGVAGETPQQWLEALGSNLVHMHFVDGRPHGHLVWGDGLFPLERYLEQLNHYGYKGLLGQMLTDGRYFDDPAAADKRNVAAFAPYFKG